MANISHKNLSGSQLHEAKGIDAAADDTVLTSTGHASVWKKLTANNLTGSGNSFGGQLLHVRDEQNGAVNGWNYPAGGFNAIRLNTVKTNEIGASLNTSTYAITLPAGTYFFSAVAPFNATNLSKLRLRNVTDSATLLVGQHLVVTAGTSYQNIGTLTIGGRFTLAASKDVAIEAYVATQNFVAASGVGAEKEVYLDAFFWKIA